MKTLHILILYLSSEVMQNVAVGENFLEMNILVIYQRGITLISCAGGALYIGGLIDHCLAYNEQYFSYIQDKNKLNNI